MQSPQKDQDLFVLAHAFHTNYSRRVFLYNGNYILLKSFQEYVTSGITIEVCNFQASLILFDFQRGE